MADGPWAAGCSPSGAELIRDIGDWCVPNVLCYRDGAGIPLRWLFLSILKYKCSWMDVAGGALVADVTTFALAEVMLSQFLLLGVSLNRSLFMA